MIDTSGLEDLGEYVVIILDASAPDRLGKLWPQLSRLEILIIDHHSSSENFGRLQFIHPGSPSTSYLVQLLIEQLGYQPDAEEAELLLLGLCTDTGFFRHLAAGTADVFQAVSRLSAAGAAMKTVYRQMFGGINLAERKLLGQVLCRTEEHFQGRLLLTSLGLADKQALAPMHMKTEEVYRLLQMVAGCDLLIFIKQDTTDRFSVSFRSSGNITVDNLAAALGGGGHKQAAGCELQGTYQQVRQQVLDTVHQHLKG